MGKNTMTKILHYYDDWGVLIYHIKEEQRFDALLESQHPFYIEYHPEQQGVEKTTIDINGHFVELKLHKDCQLLKILNDHNKEQSDCLKISFACIDKIELDTYGFIITLNGSNEHSHHIMEFIEILGNANN